MEPTPDVPAPISAPVDPRVEARQRAERCGREIESVLTAHRCRIVPYLMPVEPIGSDGSKALLQASFGIVPE